MNPWLQRFLISIAAGTVVSAGQVATAKRPHRLKKRSKKKQSKEPVQMGQQALKDAKAPTEPPLSLEEWTDGIKALPSRVAGVFKREKAAVETGAKEPDEVQTKDGVTTKKKRKKGKRKQATIWDSAKESMRQTVKDVVKEEVKDTPVGAAADAAKNVQEVAKTVGEKAKEVGASVVENAGPTAQKVKEGAIKVAGNAKSLFNKLMEKMDANPPQSLLKNDDEGAPPPGTPGEPLAPSAVESAPADHAPPEHASPENASQSASSENASSENAPSENAPSENAPAERVETAAPEPEQGEQHDGKPAIDVGEVGKKISDGLNSIGSWLQGPGAPQSKRVKPKTNGENVDAVEAKDPEPKDPIN